MILNFFIRKYIRKLNKEYSDAKKNNIFNLSHLDEKSAKIADFIYKINSKKFFSPGNKNNKNIAFAATELYDSGGHTECAKSLIKSLAPMYKLKLFLTRKDNSEEFAPVKLADIGKYSDISGMAVKNKNIINKITELYNQIAEFSPKVVFIYMHMNDYVLNSVLHLLKKHTDIKLFYFNHASFLPCLGFSFSDLIIECMPSTLEFTAKERGTEKCVLVGLQSLSKQETAYFSEEEIKDFKKSITINTGEYVTMTGSSAHKLFVGEKSPYFEMIKRLLIGEPKLKHIVISNFNDKQNKIIESIFSDNPHLRKRIIMCKFRPDFDILFQSCDVFIDSFPISSALTQIDLMRNKKATVVKINRKDPRFSFHEYMPVDYPYMFEDENKMEEGIFKLIYDKEERSRIERTLYEHYLKNYESDIVRDKYVKLIDNSDRPEQFYVK